MDRQFPDPISEVRDERRIVVGSGIDSAETSERAGVGIGSDDRIPIEKLEELEHRYDLEDGESVVDAVLTVVASVQGCDPLALPPLYEAIDPNSLESTWNGTAMGPAGLNRTVWSTFVLDRTLVTVTSAGSIYAAEFDDVESSS